jgi:hypothetical protein
MDIYTSLEFLQAYVSDTIETDKPTLEPENGVRAMMNLVQQDYKFDLGLRDNVGGKPLDGLVDAVYASYPSDKEWIEEFADRDYVSDVILKNNIDTEEYANAIKHYVEKWKSKDGEMSFADGYEATHWIWGLYEICKDNHIMNNYRKLMSDCLVMVYHTFPNSDLKTESLYFLTLVDLPRVKEEWIINLQRSQEPDGDFDTTVRGHSDLSAEQSRTYSVHHICLALLAMYEYYNEVRVR